LVCSGIGREEREAADSSRIAWKPAAAVSFLAEEGYGFGSPFSPSSYGRSLSLPPVSRQKKVPAGRKGRGGAADLFGCAEPRSGAVARGVGEAFRARATHHPPLPSPPLGPQTKYDFTAMGGVLLAALLTLVGASLVMAFFPATKVGTIVISSAGALVFSAYLVFDIQLIMGGRALEIGPDDYVLAALCVYIDVINLFLYILNLINAISGNRG